MRLAFIVLAIGCLPVCSAAQTLPIGTGTAVQWETDDPEASQFGVLVAKFDEMPGQRFAIGFPEWFTSRDDIWYVVPDFDEIDSANAVGAWSSPELQMSFTVTVYREPGEITLAWEFAVTNTSDEVIQDLAAFNHFGPSPNYLDREMNRTYAHNEFGQREFLRPHALHNGESRPQLRFYHAVNGVDLHLNPGLEALNAISDARFGGNSMSVFSPDGRIEFITLVDGPVAYFFNNWDQAHGCIHAAPLLGEVEPNETAHATGRIIIRAVDDQTQWTIR